MRAATTSAISGTAGIAPQRPATASRGASLAGLAIASLLPAIFWTVLISEAAGWSGIVLAPATLALTCVSITLFLVMVCGPLVFEAPR